MTRLQRIGRGLAVAGVTAVGAVSALTVAFAAVKQPPNEYRWRLPRGFPVPKVPPDNPMSEAKVELGRRLFYDVRLSGNRMQSCASCHRQELSFADPLPRAVGSTGELHPCSSMSLANIAYSPALTWSSPSQRKLENQALVPMFGEEPVELGLAGKEAELVERLTSEGGYAQLFAAAFPGDRQPVSVLNVTRAIASFQRTLISGNSPYDRFKGGDQAAISAAAVRGERLFFSERTECFHCHGGFNFTGTVDYVGKGFVEVEFHNTGLYNLGGKGEYPAPNVGVSEHTGDPEDMGKFKAPSLRNVGLTAPYMHDGSIPTLEQVIDHYAAGGRTIESGQLAGVGSRNPFKSGFVKGFRLTTREKTDLVAFLRSLTDSTFITDPRFSNPHRASARLP